MISVRTSDGTAIVHVFDEVVAEDLARFEKSIGEAVKIEVYIDTIGGDSNTAFGVYKTLRQRDATAYITRAFSAGSIIAMGCRRIHIEKDGSVMLHEATACSYGRREKLLEDADRLKDLNEAIVRVYSDRTGATHEAVRRWMAADSFFTATGAINAGLADEIFELPRNIIAPSRATRSATVATAPTCDESKAEFLLQALQAIGPITTADRERLLSDVRYWALTNITQFAVPSAAEAGARSMPCSETAPLAA